jgi:hypothetical protein
MNTAVLTDSMTTLMRELVDGAPHGGAYVLNGGDPGLLASLDRIDAAAASESNDGGATIAAHVAHLDYGISLMNRWAGGEANPFATADWGAAWQTGAVTEAEWAELRATLREQVQRWQQALGRPRDVMPIELNGMMGSIVHLAYHLGAIRQIDRTLRGPRDTG